MFDDRIDPNRDNKRKSLFYNFEVLTIDNKPVGRLGDITLEGLKVVSEQPIEVNTTLHLKLKLPEKLNQNEQITFEAESVWCKEVPEEKCFHTGFKTKQDSPDNIRTIKVMMDLLASPQDLIL